MQFFRALCLRFRRPQIDLIMVGETRLSYGLPPSFDSL